jgi:hypothetical protein
LLDRCAIDPMPFQAHIQCRQFPAKGALGIVTGARELIGAAFPEVMISLSCEVDPTFREYERTCVTAFDAYVKPILDRYLEGMERDLRSSGIEAPALL